MNTLLEPGIMNILTNDAGITGIVGTRIYSSHLPEECNYPALLFFEVSSIEMPEASVARPRFQFSCYAETEIEAKQLSDAVIAALKNVSGVKATISIPKTIYLGRNRIHDAEMDLWNFATDFIITYKE